MSIRAADPPSNGTAHASRAPATQLPGKATSPWLLLRGEALESSRCLPAACFDLIYADPPFYSGRVHRAPARHGRSQHSQPVSEIGFDDRWGADLDDYLAWLEPRLARMRDLLATTGSLFVHLDWHAAHAAKLLLDRIFGRVHFVNEIIWSYRTGGVSGRWLARKHDTIFFYARSRAYKFNPLSERSYLAHRYGFRNVNIERDGRGLYRNSRMRDVWEIPALRGNMPERVAFPTQKPLALLRRIVALVTDPGDLVGDLFCGSGTTLLAAIESGRKAIGMDNCPAALALAQSRLRAFDTEHARSHHELTESAANLSAGVLDRRMEVT